MARQVAAQYGGHEFRHRGGIGHHADLPFDAKGIFVDFATQVVNLTQHDPGVA